MAEDGTDETVLDSWEELDDSRVLDKKLKEIKISSQENKKTNSSAVISDANDRTQYQPQVRILKRKSDTGSPSSTLDTSKSNVNKPAKTLEQREAEYAQARLRIMGAAYVQSDAENPETAPSDEANQNSNSPCVFTTGSFTNVEVMRQPRGPDGSKGFDQPR